MGLRHYISFRLSLSRSLDFLTLPRKVVKDLAPSPIGKFLGAAYDRDRDMLFRIHARRRESRKKSSAPMT